GARRAGGRQRSGSSGQAAVSNRLQPGCECEGGSAVTGLLEEPRRQWAARIACSEPPGGVCPRRAEFERICVYQLGAAMEECNCTGKNNTRFISRRDLLFQAGEGLGGLALVYLLVQDRLIGALASEQACSASGVKDSPYLPKAPHFKPRAKSVISLFMCGGVSQVDSFDYKPTLEKF